MLVRTYLGGMFGIRDPVMFKTFDVYSGRERKYIPLMNIEATEVEGEGYLSPYESPVNNNSNPRSPFFLPSS